MTDIPSLKHCAASDQDTYLLAHDGDNNMPESLLPFYVYVLADPDDILKVFYVGMGRDERALSHWKEVRRLIGNQQQGAHPKHERMMAIARDGREPIQAVIGRFETQDEAYAVESTLINWVYGYDNLTNQNRGRNPDQIRPFNCGRELEGIDVERRITDGAVMTLVDLDQQRDQKHRQRFGRRKQAFPVPRQQRLDFVEQLCGRQ